MGTASHSLTSLKNNRALLKKRKNYGEIREMYQLKAQNDGLEFKEVTPLRLKQIKKEIRDDFRKAAKVNFIFQCISILGVIGIVLLLILLFKSLSTY